MNVFYLEAAAEQLAEVWRLDEEDVAVDGELLLAAGDGEVREKIVLVEPVLISGVI